MTGAAFDRGAVSRIFRDVRDSARFPRCPDMLLEISIKDPGAADMYAKHGSEE